MIDLATLGTIAAFLVPGGGFGAWVVNEFRKINDKLEACEKRDRECQDGFRAMAGCCTLLIKVTRSIEPHSPQLTQIAALLKTAFPIDPNVPSSLTAIIKTLEETDQ